MMLSELTAEGHLSHLHHPRHHVHIPSRAVGDTPRVMPALLMLRQRHDGWMSPTLPHPCLLSPRVNVNVGNAEPVVGGAGAGGVLRRQVWSWAAQAGEL